MKKNYLILKGLVVKEFILIVRDWRTLILLLGMPGMLVLLFGFVMNIEIQDAKVAIMDNDKGKDSKYIINKISNSKFFKVEKYVNTEQEIDNEFKKGTIQLVFVFNKQFSYDLHHKNEARMQLISDGSKLMSASSLVNYGTAIIKEYEQTLRRESLSYIIIPEIRMFYNPNLDGRYMTLPGLMAFIIMLVSSLITSLSIAKEKELGTMELLLSTPVNRYFVMIAKIIPYLLTSLINAFSIIWLCKYVFEIPIVGDINLLFITTALFIFTCVELGILI
jgi:ABC-2 type transport system permease protein